MEIEFSLKEIAFISHLIARVHLAYDFGNPTSWQESLQGKIYSKITDKYPNLGDNYRAWRDMDDGFTFIDGMNESPLRDAYIQFSEAAWSDENIIAYMHNPETESN